MKNLSVFVGLFFGIGTAFAQHPGQQVAKTADNSLEFGIVKKVSADHQSVLMDNGEWLKTWQVFPLEESLRGIRLLETVMVETFWGYRFQKVTAIANGQFFLDNGHWYPPVKVHRLETELKRIKLGDEVILDVPWRWGVTRQKVLAISNVMFFLDDGEWYPPMMVQKAE